MVILIYFTVLLCVG